MAAIVKREVEGQHSILYPGVNIASQSSSVSERREKIAGTMPLFIETASPERLRVACVAKLT